jgi:hypothetical protein
MTFSMISGTSSVPDDLQALYSEETYVQDRKRFGALLHSAAA